MRAEIGSEFWDVPVSNIQANSFPESTKWFISGTSALKYILEDIEAEKNIKTASLPSWCCSCMITPFLEKKYSVRFYDVFYDKETGLSVDYTTTPECDVTLVLSYFGFNDLHIVGRPSGIIIRDVTHSLFSKPVYDDAVYYFGSTRKWMGIWTGGFGYKKTEWATNIKLSPASIEYVNMRKKAMLQKQEYLAGYREDKGYLSIFEKAEDFLDQCGIEGPADRDVELMPFIDVPNVVRQRRSNAGVLISAFNSFSIFPEIKQDDCPMFVPILVDENIRDKLRSYLISKKIYCPIHWNISEYHRLNSKTEKIYKKEISLVCDQRYGIADMRRIIEEVTAFMKV